MLSGAKHLRGDSSGFLSLRMTVPFMVMLRSKATKHLRGDSSLTLRMTPQTVMPPNEMRIRHLPYYKNLKIAYPRPYGLGAMTVLDGAMTIRKFRLLICVILINLTFAGAGCPGGVSKLLISNKKLSFWGAADISILVWRIRQTVLIQFRTPRLNF